MVLIDTCNGALRKVPAWPVYVVGLIPMGWLFWLGLTGGLGPEPIEALEHRYGLIGLQFMIASLSVSPLRNYAGINLVRFRRAIGLLSFYYILAHLSVWLVLDIGSLSQVWTEIVKRPYITIGMAGFVFLLPLGLTSNDMAVRRLGPARWRNLHKVGYLAVALGVLHYVMLTKGWQLQPLVYAVVVFGLLALRMVPRPRSVAAMGR